MSNTFWSVVFNWVAQIGGMIGVPLFIRNIGEELYGIWVITYVIMGYSNIFDFGFTQGLQKYVAEARINKDKIQLSEVVVSGLGLLCVVGVVTGTAIMFSAGAIVRFFKMIPEHEFVATQLLQITGFLSIFTWPLRITEVILNAAFRLKELAFVNAIRQVVHSIVLVAFVYLGVPIIPLKWFTSIAYLLLFIPAVFLVSKYVPEIDWNLKHFRLWQIRRMSKFSFGIFYLSCLSMLSVRIDNLVLGRIVGMSAVAIYSILSKPFETIRQISSMSMQSLLPVSFNVLPKASVAEREALMINAVKYRTLILAPITAVAIALVPKFTSLWVGDKYAEYAVWGQVFLSVHFFMGLSSMGAVARVGGAMQLSNTMLTVKVLTNVVFSIILTHKIGLGGVILGTIISNVVFGELMFGRFICKKMEVNWIRLLKNYSYPTVTCILFMCCFLALNVGHYIHSWLQLFMAAVVLYGMVIGLVAALFLREESGDAIAVIQRRIKNFRLPYRLSPQGVEQDKP